MVGYAGATLCATVFHVLRTNRLGVDIPFTHSPSQYYEMFLKEQQGLGDTFVFTE